MNSLSAIEIKISELEEKNIHPWDKTIEEFFGKDYVFTSIDSISIPPDFDIATIIPKLKASKGKLQNNVFNGISNDVTVSHINKLPFLDGNGEYDKSKQKDYINLLQMIKNIPKDELQDETKTGEHSKKILYEFLRIFN